METQDKIVALFARSDANGDGFISEDELRTVLGALGISEAEATQMFQCADANQDGKIDYDEFVEWAFSDDKVKGYIGKCNSQVSTKALETAAEHLEKTAAKHIQELKALGKPPGGVDDVCAAVAILLQRPKKKPDWKACQMMMSNTHKFINDLRKFDVDSITHQELQRLKPIVSQPNFNVEVMQKKSLAAAHLCGWVLAMVAYAEGQPEPDAEGQPKPAVVPAEPAAVPAEVAAQEPAAEAAEPKKVPSPDSLEALGMANSAATSVTKKGIQDLKSFPNMPPPECTLVCSAVGVLLKGDAKFPDDFKAVQKMMNNPAFFIDELKSFDPESITDNELQVVKTRTKGYDEGWLTIDTFKGKSKACFYLLEWVLAMVEYVEAKIEA